MKITIDLNEEWKNDVFEELNEILADPFTSKEELKPLKKLETILNEYSNCPLVELQSYEELKKLYTDLKDTYWINETITFDILNDTIYIGYY